MADYSALKQTIDNNIYSNGEQRITGEILNSVLNEMVDVLGEGGGGGVSGGLVAVVEEGFYIVDENLNIGAYLDEEGWHAINVLEYTIVNR